MSFFKIRSVIKIFHVILISNHGTTVRTTWLEAATSLVLMKQLADRIRVYSIDAEEFIIILLQERC